MGDSTRSKFGNSIKSSDREREFMVGIPPQTMIIYIYIYMCVCVLTYMHSFFNYLDVRVPVNLPASSITYQSPSQASRLPVSLSVNPNMNCFSRILTDRIRRVLITFNWPLLDPSLTRWTSSCPCRKCSTHHSHLHRQPSFQLQQSVIRQSVNRIISLRIDPT